MQIPTAAVDAKRSSAAGSDTQTWQSIGGSRHAPVGLLNPRPTAVTAQLRLPPAWDRREFRDRAAIPPPRPGRMELQPMSPSIEHALSTHAAALRKLARDLVGADAADDVLQDTALQALQHPPRRDGEVRGWLVRIVQRLSLRHRRSTQRRKRHETAVEPPQGPRGPDAEIEHRDTVRHVTDALLALPAVYQRALLLRYFEDLTPTAIAARTGESLGTVKSRLARGLVMLRERMDARGDGGEWRAALGLMIGLRRGAPIGAAAAAATGVMLMGTGMKLVLGGLGAAVAIAAARWSLQVPLPASPTSAMHDAAPVVAEQADARSASTAAEAPQRTEVETPALTPPTATPNFTVRGRVLDEDGQPVAAAVVTLLPRSRAYSTPEEQSGDPTCTANAGGTFELPVAVDAANRSLLRVRHDGFCPAATWLEATPGATLDLGDIVLSTAITVQGRVTDEQGHPQAGVRLRLYRQDTDDHRRVAPESTTFATSNDDGSFRAWTPLPPGHGGLNPENRSLLHGATLDLQLDRSNPAPHIEVVVCSAEPEGIDGIVVDTAGQPIHNAMVNREQGGTGTSTDSDGRFAVPFLAQYGPGPFRLRATADGFEPLTTPPLPRGTRDAKLVLQRAPELLVRVVDAEGGTPVTDFQLMLLSAAPSFSQLQRVAKHHYTDGVARLSGVPRGDCGVWVEAEDENLAPSTFVPVHVGDGPTTEVQVRLQPRAHRLLRVQDNGGHSLAGVAVELIDTGGQPLRRDTYAYPPMQRPWSGALFEAQLLQRGTTDDNGELELRGPPRPGLGLRLSGGGVSLQVFAGISLADQAPLQLTAERAATWTGRLVPVAIGNALLRHSPQRRDDDKLGLDLWREDDALQGRLDPPRPIDTDGSFHIDGIPSGTWQVSLRIGGRHWHAVAITVAAGDTLRQDLDVSPVAPLHLDLRVFLDGKPFADRNVNILAWCAMGLSGRRMGDSNFLRTDAEGRLAVDTFAGQFQCHLYLPGTGDAEVVMAQPFTLATAGHAQHVLDVKLASASLRLLQPDGAGAAGVELCLSLPEGGQSTQSFAHTDKDGLAALGHLAAGPHLLRVRPRSLGTQPAQHTFAQQHGYEALQQAWIDLPPLELLPGTATQPLVIHLPRTWDR